MQALLQGPGGILVEPENVQEGEDVEVAYDGQGSLYYSVDLGPWQELPIDPATGKGKVTAPVGASFLVISDRDLQGGSRVVVEIFNTASPP